MLQDLRFAMRSLVRARGFSIAAVLTLALGIGANTIVYGVVNGLILRPLPFGDRSDRLVTLHSTHPTQAQDWDDSDVSYPDLLDIRAGSRTLAAVEGVVNRNLSLSAEDRTERVVGASVTPGLFTLLGVRPQIGRDFVEADAAEPGRETVALISHDLWQRLYAGDPDIVGRAVPVNARAVTIIGVMPTRFSFPETQDIWLPYRRSSTEGRDGRSMLAVGLLQPGADLADARAELATLAATLAVKYPDTNRNWGLHVLRLRDLFVQEGTRRSVTAMLTAVALVLLVACANVASLLITRAVGRQHELTLRSALGASRARVTMLLMAESVLLAIGGGLLGVMLASWGLDALVASMPEPPVYWASFDIDGRVLIFAIFVSLCTALACGLGPALRASRTDISSSLAHGGRTSSASPDARRWQGLLVVAQVAISLALLVGATLLSKSAMTLQTADTGFDAGPLLSLRTYVAGGRYDDPAARARAVGAIVESLSKLPRVVAAAATGAIPGDDGGDGIRLLPERGVGAPGDELGAQVVPITPAFFQTLGLQPIEGRTFTTAEAEHPLADVVVVNKRLADTLWPGQSALGHVLQVVATERTHGYRVVGVVPDVVYEELGEETAQSRLIVYAPYGRLGWRTMAMLVRTQMDPASITAQARVAVRDVDSSFAAFDVLTMTDRRLVTNWGERFLGRTFAAFAIAAVLLACLGIYGLTAYSAAQRTREIGVRLAIGAQPTDIVRLFLARGVTLGTIGAAVGLPLAVAAARMIEEELFRVSPWDRPVWTLLPLVLIASVLLASFLPARQASLTDPSIALRVD
jgi:putative ABC transport system permease protein